MAEPVTEKDRLDRYMDAMWSYILEHSDILESGALFVKFHTDGRRNFEKRIWARFKYNYHRGDPVAREKEHDSKRLQDWERRLEAKEKFLKNMARGKRILLWRKIAFYFSLDKHLF